jgi:hypothetical protein
MLNRAETLCLHAARALAAMGLITLIGFAVATLLDGLLRSLADRPIIAVGDVGSYVVAASVAACFPLAHLQRANITIELAGMALGPRVAHGLPSRC